MSCPARSFYNRSTSAVARELIGNKLVRTISTWKRSKTRRLSGLIVETEAYGYLDDEASHASMGQTSRNSVMFGPVGRAYVHFTYGKHFCVNVSARSSKRKAGAVLIRAIKPVEGLDIMRQFRKRDEIFSLTSGPGKLAQALDISDKLNGIDVTNPASQLHVESGINIQTIASSRRIGITRAIGKNWRFFVSNNPFVSRF